MTAAGRLRVIEGDLGLYTALERRIADADADGVIARWEFGKALLAEREAHGGNQLPPGRIQEVCAALGKTRSSFEREIRWRMKLAERYPTREEVGTAVPTFGSWSVLRDSLVGEETAQPKEMRAMSRQLNAVLDRRVGKYWDAVRCMWIYRPPSGVAAHNAPRPTSPYYRWHFWLRDLESTLDRGASLPAFPASSIRPLGEYLKLSPRLRRIADELERLIEEEGS